jgi:hypothetical protein
MSRVNPGQTRVSRVKRLTLAMDLGTVVNPDGVKAQIEGSALWGMSLALFEEGAAQRTSALQVSQLRRLHAAADERDAGARHLDHRQQRPAVGLRRARRHGGGAGDRQRDLQSLRRARRAAVPITQAAVREALQAKKT